MFNRSSQTIRAQLEYDGVKLKRKPGEAKGAGKITCFGLLEMLQDGAWVQRVVWVSCLLLHSFVVYTVAMLPLDTLFALRLRH